MTRHRTQPARGLSYEPDDWEPESEGPATTTATADAGQPNRGGRYGAGWIRRAAIVTRGEAAGHELWIDAIFLGSIVDAINARPEGIKSRWSHPSYCNDGLGRAVGRVTDAYLDGDTVRADIHFLDAATRAPEGDLPGYLLDLADEDPTLFGVSISFTADPTAETAFLAEHSTTGQFVSPDPDNANGMPHARLSRLHAADIVDEPAANPDGLFSAANRPDWDATAAYMTGQTHTAPQPAPAGIHLPTARRFFAAWLRRANLSLTPTPPMSTQTSPTDPKPPHAPTPTEAAPTPPAAETDHFDAGRRHAAEEAAEYRRRWGTAGLVYWADGLTPEAAADAHAEQLQAEINTLRAARGTTPLATATAPTQAPPVLRGRDRLVEALKTQFPPR